jgi:hypothetical protein
MTVGEMLSHTKRLKGLNSLRGNQRNIRLANMMTDLERAFHITMVRNEKFNQMNTFLMQLYRTVSAERDI